MFVYQIANKVNGKLYIGITNNPEKRWANHRCNNDPSMVIAKAIKKYGVRNFEFKVLYSGLTIEEASNLEIQLIKEKKTRVPDGYNVAEGGMYNICNRDHQGAENGRAKLTEEEARYIKDHRNIPIYLLYEEFNQKIGYDAFKDVYQDRTYKNIPATVPEYPYNMEFTNQFNNNSKLTYEQVVELRQKYASHIDWRTAYQDYKKLFPDELTFWNIYVGNRYKLVMPEVFTPENKHFQASFSHSGEKNGRAKLTRENVEDIRRMYRIEKIDKKEICKKYPQVTRTTINNILDNKTWIY